MKLAQIYDTFDEMEKMKRYKPPTEDYFPTSGEIVTYVNSDIEGIIPYLLWLENSLTPAGMELHKEARATLRKIIDNQLKEGKLEDE